MLKIKRDHMFMLTILLTSSFFFSGCEPLRKKFVRQKKKTQKEEFIPVLDPIDYPQTRVSSEDKYAYNFSMWQVWSKDLRHLMIQDTMDKRKKYLAAQIISQLLELKRWTPDEYVSKIDQAILEYEKIQKELEKPEMMRNKSLIDGQLRRIDSFLRNEMDPDIVFVEES